jgi:protein-S-isoprenylcysteine O-methyltransferase Ste14
MALLVVSIIVARPLTSRPALDLALSVAAFLLVLLGGGVRSWAMGYHVWRRRHGEQGRRTLITAGPYSLVRNPLYLGTLLLSAGVALMSGSITVIVVYAIVFIGGYLAIIHWEESRLTGQFGESYRDYFASVPRLVPAPRIWGQREGTFSFDAMMRCMEPVKTVGFLVALALMMYLKARRVAS